MRGEGEAAAHPVRGTLDRGVRGWDPWGLPGPGLSSCRLPGPQCPSGGAGQPGPCVGGGRGGGRGTKRRAASLSLVRRRLCGVAPALCPAWPGPVRLTPSDPRNYRITKLPNRRGSHFDGIPNSEALPRDSAQFDQPCWAGTGAGRSESLIRTPATHLVWSNGSLVTGQIRNDCLANDSDWRKESVSTEFDWSRTHGGRRRVRAMRPAPMAAARLLQCNHRHSISDPCTPSQSQPTDGRGDGGRR